MKSNRNNAGFSLAEMLIVVAILIVLFGLSFIIFTDNQRSLTQMEYDTIAREIFIASQNHLTVASSQGYLNTSDYGTPANSDIDKAESAYSLSNPDFYYIMVENGTAVQENGSTSPGSEMLNIMLPFGSIDPIVYSGSFIIRYQKSSATVLDVFYSNPNGTTALTVKGTSLLDEYDNLMEDYRGADKKNERKHFDGNKVVGWFGNEEGIPKGERLSIPYFKIVNAEQLRIEVTDTNADNTNASLKLIIEGKSSEAKKAVVLRKDGGSQASPGTRVTYDGDKKVFTIILDDVTTPGFQFKYLGTDNGKAFYPGEDLKIQVVAYNNKELANPAWSREGVTNSLFGDPETGTETETVKTANIRNIRHLENLSNEISGFSAKKDNFIIFDVKQKVSLDWNDFCQKIGVQTSKSPAEVRIYSNNESVCSNGGSFYPVNQSAPEGVTPSTFIYDGEGNSISNVVVTLVDNNDTITDAGLFGNTASLEKIENLELIDFSISGSTSAGALAGTLTGTKVNNVLARNSTGDETKKINATGSAGGLIGVLNGGSVEYSAAALLVNGDTVAGGLIGTTTETTIVKGCYSGGHTYFANYYTGERAEYNDNTGYLTNGKYNITGATAGGLIGDSDSATIKNSYSTCSVSGTTAGGFLGIGGGVVTNCYCTGLVYPEKVRNTDQTTNTTTDTIIDNAFYGNTDISGSSNYIYGIINEVHLMENGKLKEIKYKDDNSGAASQFDLAEDSYNLFTDCIDNNEAHQWTAVKPAVPYDSKLTKYYNNKYLLRSVPQLSAKIEDGVIENIVPKYYYVNTHYGDWPAPEIFIINTP